MTDQERKALESNIARLAAEINERGKSLAPITAKISGLQTQLCEQRNANETLITENASLSHENEQLQTDVEDAEPSVTIMKAEMHRLRRTAHEVLHELVLLPTERMKREHLIKSADSFFSLRMWVGVWKAELDGNRLKTSVPHQSEPSAEDAPVPVGEGTTYTPLSPDQY